MPPNLEAAHSFPNQILTLQSLTILPTKEEYESMISLLFFLLTSNSALAFSDTTEVTELQWAICEESPGAVLQKLQVPEPAATEEKISYFESNRFEYQQYGISMRIKNKKKGMKSVVKVRNLISTLSVTPDNCERDRHGQEVAVTCSLDNKVSGKKIWSNDQKEFAEAVTRVNWDDLIQYGPYKVDEHVFSWNGQEFSLETLKLSHGKSIMELSIRIKNEQSNNAYEEISNQLHAQGVTLCSSQEGKSKRLFDQISSL